MLPLVIRDLLPIVNETLRVCMLSGVTFPYDLTLSTHIPYGAILTISTQYLQKWTLFSAVNLMRRALGKSSPAELTLDS